MLKKKYQRNLRKLKNGCIEQYIVDEIDKYNGEIINKGSIVGCIQRNIIEECIQCHGLPFYSKSFNNFMQEIIFANSIERVRGVYDKYREKLLCRINV